jgi:AraC-like DNA-binding protein
MDTLSDVLKTIRLKGAIFFTVEASSPWVAEAPNALEIGQRIMPGVQHLIEYHIVIKGRCWGGIAGSESVRLSEGDVIVFPHGDAHVMSSAPGMRAAPQMKLYVKPPRPQLPFNLTLGDGGPEKAGLLCGFLGCDLRPFNPLLETLPRVLHVRADKGEGWLGELVRLTVFEAENKRPGGDCVLARMSELMFIEVVRRHLETLPEDETGWLAGLRDNYIGEALALMHNSPEHNWTVEELAHRIGLSRSVFAERFMRLVGHPPMQYLTQWRMQLASRLISTADNNIAEIALKVGYESEAACSRAFKKFVGMPPRAWGRRHSESSVSEGCERHSVAAGG